jgi:hypothetical protein
MGKKYQYLALLAILLIVGLVIYQTTREKTRESAFEGEPPETLPDMKPVAETAIADDFQTGRLSEELWKLTKQNDFKQSIIEIFDVGKGDKRLRMMADTIGTKDDTVKFHGARSIARIDFNTEKKVSFDLDWNNQVNGCYLTAGVYLCPTAQDANPRDGPDWIALEYVGVPPGKNARFQVARKAKGNLRFLFTEGWPDKQRTGRKIGNQHVELLLDKKILKVMENGKELFSTHEHGINFTQAYLYLQMSSHSNYPAREIYFDNIRVKSANIDEASMLHRP